MEINNQTTTYNTWTPFQDEIIETLVFQDNIEIIYRRHSMVTNGLGNRNDKVIKKVFSRFDGSVKEIEGEIIPEQPERYVFNQVK